MPVSVIQNASFGNNSIVTANGIKFPATKVPSADANTLDDYEEGTWTPNLKSNGTTGNATGGSILGRYTKIGNQVTVWFGFSNCGTSGVANAGQSLTITGLPFTISSAANSGWGTSQGVIATAQSFGNGGINPVSNNTYATFFDSNLVSGVAVGLDAGNVKTASIFCFGFITYQAA